MNRGAWALIGAWVVLAAGAGTGCGTTSEAPTPDAGLASVTDVPDGPDAGGPDAGGQDATDAHRPEGDGGGGGGRDADGSVQDAEARTDGGGTGDGGQARDTGGSGTDGGTTGDAGPGTDGTGVPRIDAVMKAAMRAVFLRGMSLGNRAVVFGKMGDSITESGSFMMDFAGMNRDVNLGAHTDLAATLAYYSTALVDGTHTSFDRPSSGAMGGWTSGDALTGSPTPVENELGVIHPAVAVVMYGTNDLDRSDLATWLANMNRIVSILLDHGTIPVLSTIPDRYDVASAGALVPTFNTALRALAARRGVPYEDYWLATQPLPHHGISDDGIHPNAYYAPDGVHSAWLNAIGLLYGYNMRNLLTLQALDHVRRVVIDDGPSDP